MIKINQLLQIGVAAAMVFASSTARAQEVISINFGSNRQAMNSDDSAGVVSEVNWNNAGATGGSGASATLSNMTDNLGVPTGVSVVYGSNAGDTWSTGAKTSSDQKMMYGYLDSGTASGAASTITVSGLTYGQYDIYIYHQVDVDGRYGYVTLNGGAWNLIEDEVGDFAGEYVETQDDGASVTTVGNYIKYNGVTGSSFTIVGNAPVNSQSVGFTGMQIVETAPASDYTLTYTAGTNGTLSGPSPQVILPGADGATVTAIPDLGYVFWSWSDGVTTAARTEVNVIRNVNVTADFFEPTNTLTYTAGANGTIAGLTTQDIDLGDDGAEVTAIPDNGYLFVNWSDGFIESSRTDYTVTQDVTVQANFTAIVYPLAYTAGANGSISGTIYQPVARFTDGAQVTAVADSGYHFVDWSDGVTSIQRQDTYILGEIAVRANFASDSAPVALGPIWIYQNAQNYTFFNNLSAASTVGVINVLERSTDLASDNWDGLVGLSGWPNFVDRLSTMLGPAVFYRIKTQSYVADLAAGGPPMAAERQVITRRSGSKVIIVDYLNPSVAVWSWDSIENGIGDIRGATDYTVYAPNAIYPNKTMLLAAWATCLLDMETGEVLFMGSCPGSHDAVLLPQGQVASFPSAHSGKLKFFRISDYQGDGVSVAPFQEFLDASGHGLVWDADRQILFTGAGNTIRKMKQNPDGTWYVLAVISSAPGGIHSFASAYDGTHLILSGVDGVYYYNMDTDDFFGIDSLISTVERNGNPNRIGGVKSIDIHPRTREIIWKQMDGGAYNTPYVYWGVASNHEVIQLPYSFYKARWAAEEIMP